jgi:hypothetical protein
MHGDGPWFIDGRYDGDAPSDGWEIAYASGDDETARLCIVEGLAGYPEIERTADFIANAPSDIAYLLEQLASVPSQVEAAVKAEREECLNAALDVLDSKTMRYEYCVNAGDAVTAAIRSRGETSL